MTSFLMHHSCQIIRSFLDAFCEERIHLSPQKQDNSKVIEENNQDKSKACLPYIAIQKVRCVEWEQREIDLQGNSHYNCSTPTIAKTYMWFRNNHVQSFEQDPGDNKASQNAEQRDDETSSWNGLKYRVLEEGESY